MNRRLLSLYHALPGPLRSLAASYRGRQLRRWRYGSETDQLVEDYLARDSWSVEKTREWQQRKLEDLLIHAAKNVPYYRALWSKRGGDEADWKQLENWPILEKDAVRENPRSFIEDGCDTDTMFKENTSGTTGKPLYLWRDQPTVRAWYALCEARHLRWYGVTRHDNWAIMGGQLVAPVSQKRPPFWVWNSALNQLYMSVYHLSDEHFPAYLKAIAKRGIKYIYCYTSAIYEIAKWALANKVETPALSVIVTNAEPVFDYQRKTIEEAFGCPVRATYGMAEIVVTASECETGRAHLWPEVGVAEVENEQGEIVRAGSGSLIGTGLLNRKMPLIRYRVGDRATLGSEDVQCECGRQMPLLESVDGRDDDVLVTRDGRSVGRLDPVFKANFPIVEAQIIQDSREKVRIVYVPSENYDDDAGERIKAAVRERMGEMEVQLEAVEKIPRTKNGKFRAVIKNF